MENCNCHKMEIYYVSPGILSPISTPEREFRKMEVTEIVEDTLEIRRFYAIINNLDRFDDNYGDIDVRILIDLFCVGGGKATITANRGVLKKGDKYYNPSSDFFDFFENIAEKQRKKWVESVEKKY